MIKNIKENLDAIRKFSREIQVIKMPGLNFRTKNIFKVKYTGYILLHIEKAREKI